MQKTLITLHAVSNDIHNNIKEKVNISKDKILLELYMSMKYKSIFSILGLSIRHINKKFVIRGVYNKEYKIVRFMQILGFDPTFLSIANYCGFEKYELFIEPNKRKYLTLEEYIKGSNIDLEDLKNTLKNFKKSSVTVLESSHMIKIHLDDYLGFTIYPFSKTTPYYFTFEEFVEYSN